MTPLAPLVTAFFHKHLANEKGVSKNTIASYSYTFKFLCRYISNRIGKVPSALCLEDLDARIIRDFLKHLEGECGNTPRTRNLRLTAIRSFMKYVEYEVPSALDQVRQIRTLTNKRTQERLVNHLNREEMKAVLDVPDPCTRKGVRDQAMLLSGLRCWPARLRTRGALSRRYRTRWSVSQYPGARERPKATPLATMEGGCAGTESLVVRAWHRSYV